MTDALTIRRFRPGDGEAVRALDEAALRSVDAGAEDLPDADLHDVPGTYFDGGTFLVGELAGEIVATGGLQPAAQATFADRAVGPDDGPAGDITRMRVAPDHQRRGFGTRILEELEARARDLGYEVLVLETTARQAGARALYESFGYEAVERFDWREYEVLLYRKDLEG